MCDTCGCDQPGSTKFTIPGHDHAHEHGHSHDHTHTHHEHHHGDDHDHKHNHTHTHDHSHPHDHEHGHDHDHSHDHSHSHSHSHTHSDTEHSHSKVVKIEQDVLGHNNILAQRNRGYFEAKNIIALNMVSSPGSGKTTLLEKTITDLKKIITFYVIEGDQQTMNDAERINKTGAPVIQINTGNGCHLDADMINKAVKQLNVADGSMLIIENVGNLVCPAMFDLGEAHRVVVISVTEGDDKPLKYPGMFHSSDVCIINKTDLLPYVDFSIEKVKENAKKVNPGIIFFETSARTGEGMDKWYEWIKKSK